MSSVVSGAPRAWSRAGSGRPDPASTGDAVEGGPCVGTPSREAHQVGSTGDPVEGGPSVWGTPSRGAHQMGSTGEPVEGSPSAGAPSDGVHGGPRRGGPI